MSRIKDYYSSLMPETRYVVGLVGAFIIIVICSPLRVLVHEVAHLASANMLNFEVTGITIEPFYGWVDILFDSEQNTLSEVGLMAISGGVVETVLLLLISRVTVPQMRFCVIVTLAYAIGESYLMMCMMSARLVGEAFTFGLYLDIVMILAGVIYVLAILIDMHLKSEDWNIEIGLRNLDDIIKERNMK